MTTKGGEPYHAQDQNPQSDSQTLQSDRQAKAAPDETSPNAPGIGRTDECLGEENSAAAEMEPQGTALEMPIGDQEGRTLADVISDRDTPPLEETIVRQQLRDSLHDAIEACLRPREQEVLCLRFGLDGGDSQTLGEVAQKYGVTRERVRQIEVRALRRLRRAGVWKLER